jgi:stringent starvation protein B
VRIATCSVGGEIVMNTSVKAILLCGIVAGPLPARFAGLAGAVAKGVAGIFAKYEGQGVSVEVEVTDD